MLKPVLLTVTQAFSAKVTAHTENKDAKDPDKVFSMDTGDFLFPKGSELRCVVLVTGAKYLTVFDPAEQIVIFGIPRNRVDVTARFLTLQ